MNIINNNGKPVTKESYTKSGKLVIQYLLEDGTWIGKDRLYNAARHHTVSNVRIQGRGIAFIAPKLKVEKLSTNNLGKLYRFIKYINSINRYEENYTHTYFINSYESDPAKCACDYRGYIVYYGNEIIAWFTVSSTLGIKIAIPMYFASYNKYAGLIMGVQAISKLIPDMVFRYPDYVNIPNNYKYLDFKSNIYPDYCYNASGSYITSGNSRVLADKIEEKFLIKDIDTSKIKIKCIEGKDLYNIWTRNYCIGAFEGYWTNKYNIYSAIGFHYFKFDDSKKDAKFILAIYNNIIVGVIKLGVYNGDHQAIAYIDVLVSCRNKGIATYMIKNVDRFLDKKLPLLLTDESDMGKLCHMGDKFKKYVKSVKVKNYDEALKDGRYD